MNSDESIAHIGQMLQLMIEKHETEEYRRRILCVFNIDVQNHTKVVDFYTFVTQKKLNTRLNKEDYLWNV